MSLPTAPADDVGPYDVPASGVYGTVSVSQLELTNKTPSSIGGNQDTRMTFKGTNVTHQVTPLGQCTVRLSPAGVALGGGWADRRGQWLWEVADGLTGLRPVGWWHHDTTVHWAAPHTFLAPTHQLVLGATGAQTILSAPPTASTITYTLPDVGRNADVVVNEGAQTINGVKRFTQALQLDLGVSQILYVQDQMYQRGAPLWGSEQRWTAGPLTPGTAISDITDPVPVGLATRPAAASSWQVGPFTVPGFRKTVRCLVPPPRHAPLPVRTPCGTVLLTAAQPEVTLTSTGPDWSQGTHPWVLTQFAPVLGTQVVSTNCQYGASVALQGDGLQGLAGCPGTTNAAAPALGAFSWDGGNTALGQVPLGQPRDHAAASGLTTTAAPGGLATTALTFTAPANGLIYATQTGAFLTYTGTALGLTTTASSAPGWEIRGVGTQPGSSRLFVGGNYYLYGTATSVYLKADAYQTSDETYHALTFVSVDPAARTYRIRMTFSGKYLEYSTPGAGLTLGTTGSLFQFGTATTGSAPAQTGLGTTVAVSRTGRVAVVGAPQAGGTGAVAWAWRSQETHAWTWGTALLPTPGGQAPGSGARLGASLACSATGHVVAAGSPGAGRVYVWRAAGSGPDPVLAGATTAPTWTLTWVLADAGVLPSLGPAVALTADGETLFATDVGAYGGRGACSVWNTSTGSAQQPPVPGPDADPGAGLLAAADWGASLACSADGTVVVVGAPIDGGAGWVDTLVKSPGLVPGAPGAWARLPDPWQAPDVAAGGALLTTQGTTVAGWGRVASSVALDAAGRTVLVGCPGTLLTTDVGIPTGAVCSLTWAGTTWETQAVVLPPITARAPTGVQQWGLAVALSATGQRAAVGSRSGPGYLTMLV